MGYLIFQRVGYHGVALVVGPSPSYGDARAP